MSKTFCKTCGNEYNRYCTYCLSHGAINAGQLPIMVNREPEQDYSKAPLSGKGALVGLLVAGLPGAVVGACINKFKW